jgi:hypothetical protein
MITIEEKTRERFPDRNNRDNPDRQNHGNNGHQDRKRGPDNTIAMTDKQRIFPNLESSKTLKICIVSGTLREITQRETIVSSLINTQEKVIMGTRKKTTRKKEGITLKTRDFSNQREQ